MKKHCLVAALAGVALLGEAALAQNTACPGHVGPPPKDLVVQSRVTSDRAADYQNVCHLIVERVRAGIFNATKYSSGVLYRGRYLLTAAHNVYSPWYNKVRSIDVRCGELNARGAPVDAQAAGRDGVVAQGYFWRVFHRDFAVVRLDRVVPSSSPVTISAAVPGVGEVVRLAGYPGDQFCDAHILYKAEASVRQAKRPVTGIIEYKILTYTGNSGGPVFGGPGLDQLVAIHVTGSGGRVVTQSEVDGMIDQLEKRSRQRD